MMSPQASIEPAGGAEVFPRWSEALAADLSVSASRRESYRRTWEGFEAFCRGRDGGAGSAAEGTRRREWIGLAREYVEVLRHSFATHLLGGFLIEMPKMAAAWQSASHPRSRHFAPKEAPAKTMKISCQHSHPTGRTTAIIAAPDPERKRKKLGGDTGLLRQPERIRTSLG